jgi:hypothetical protein
MMDLVMGAGIGCGYRTIDEASFTIAIAMPNRLGSVVQVNLDRVGDPGGDAASEEIAVFGPDWKIGGEGGSDNRPIIGVARDPYPRFLLPNAKCPSSTNSTIFSR